jgi:hypothetical protein
MKYQMKNSILSLVVLLGLISSSCGNRTGNSTDASVSAQSDTGKAVIVFRDYTHDFGRIAEGEKVGYTFIFENNGSSALVVSSVTASCGCTAPKYDAKPIAPGSAGKVEVVFDASGMNGRQTKTVTVKSNASVPVVLLRITAEVSPTIN